MLSELHARQLLDRLCIVYGFCLSSAAADGIARNPPETAREFTDAVYRGEGLDPETADLHLYRKVKQFVATFIRDHQPAA